jgi:hypothetical protein
MPGALHLQHPANAYQVSDIAHLGYFNSVNDHFLRVKRARNGFVIILYIENVGVRIKTHVLTEFQLSSLKPYIVPLKKE